MEWNISIQGSAVLLYIKFCSASYRRTAFYFLLYHHSATQGLMPLISSKVANMVNIFFC